MDGTGKHYLECGNLDTEKQLSHVLTYSWFLNIKQKKKNSLQTTIPENLNNNEETKKTYIDLIYMESRKRQDLPNKLGAWGPWGRIEEEGRGKAGSRENVELNKNQ